MKNKTSLVSMVFVWFIFTIQNQSFAQNNLDGFIVPRTNSKAMIRQTIASTQIEIKYNRPNKRHRDIFGSLVPFNKVWRTGSDEATEIYFSTVVHIEGTSVDSGRYELFTIPSKNEWTIIIQKKLTQWGS